MKFFPPVIVLILTVIAVSCSRSDRRAEEARLRVLDSLRELDADSIERVTLDNMLSYRLTALDLPSLENTETDAIRLTVEFSWGGPPQVGPWLSIIASSDGGGCKIKATGFPNRIRQEMIDRELESGDFNKLMIFLDSIDFEEVSRFEHVDFTSTDPDRYFIERIKDGKYHAINRSSFVDVFVYRFFAEAATMAGLPDELIQRLREDEARANKKLELK